MVVSSVAISTIGLISSRTGVCFGIPSAQRELRQNIALGKHAGHNTLIIDNRDRADSFVDHGPHGVIDRR